MQIKEMSKEDLLTIVSSLPMTADGVPVVPGQHLFMIVDGVVLMRCATGGTLVASSGFVDACPSTLKRSAVRSSSRCYSTRKAAEAAKEPA